MFVCVFRLVLFHNLRDFIVRYFSSFPSLKRMAAKSNFMTVWRNKYKWVMTLSSSVGMYSVMRDKPDARKVYQWKEDELFFTYMPHANFQIY